MAAAGPVIAIGVSAVMRRLYRESLTIDHTPPRWAISTTEMP